MNFTEKSAENLQVVFFSPQEMVSSKSLAQVKEERPTDPQGQL